MPDSYYTSRWSGEEIDEGIERARMTPRPNLLDNWCFEGAEIWAKAGAGHWLPGNVDRQAFSVDTKLDDVIIGVDYATFALDGETRTISVSNIYQKPGTLPVNEQGKVGYSGGSGYTINRWTRSFTSGASLAITNGAVKVSGASSGTSYLRQKFGGIVPGVYTVSAFIRGFTGTGSIYLGYSDGTYSAQASLKNGIASLTVNTNGKPIERVQFNINAGSSWYIVAVKLEEGDTQTLAYQDSNGDWQLFERPDYATELAKCTVNHYLLEGGFLGREFTKNIGALPTDGSAAMTGNELKIGGGALVLSTGVVNGGNIAMLAAKEDKNNDASDSRYIVVWGKTAAQNLVDAVYLNIKTNGNSVGYRLYGEHNKPSGSYTGNGAARTIATGGIGKVIMVMGGGKGACYVTSNGGLRQGGNTVEGILTENIKFSGGTLTLSAGSIFNENGKSYEYQVL